MPFTIGESVGPYRILEQLGQGGMATVYKAYHASLDRYVALKVLHQAFMEDPNFQARFQREARLVAKLEHPNIVPIYDYAEHEGRPYLVMKYIEGETLKAHMAHGPLSSAEITAVIDAVGLGLSYAHRQGILHRDIKPSNVLLAKDGGTFLADFGLARIAQSGESTLSSDMIMGTPQYISPEQAMGKRDLDEGTDIYSFGVMLYEMVVGQVPFSADTPFSIIHDHIYSPLPLPRAVNPTVPETVERVLLKALSKERADRYPDVRSMVDAFKQAWKDAGKPIQGATVTLPRMPAPATVAKAPETPTLPPAAPSGGTVPPGVVPGPGPVAPAPAEATPPAAPPAKKRRSPWVWVAAVFLLVLCCLVVVWAWPLRNRLNGLRPGNVQATMEAAITTSLPTIEGAPAGTPVSPAIETARRKAEQNPTDPYARFDLALAYWDAGMPRQALENFARAVEVAGDNQEFLRTSGEKLMQRQAWIGAASMYLRLAELTQPNVPDDVLTALHESVYMGSGSNEFTIYIEFARIGALDQPLMLVAQGRNALYQGKMEDAQTFLADVKRLKPDLIEAKLLEAEIALKQGKPEDARRMLNNLISNLGAPDWVRMLATDLLNRNK